MSTGTLYVVATPIGNLEDLSPRALRTLKEVAAVACEDTRTTRKLLSHFGVSKPVIAFFQHSSQKRLEELLRRLRSGEDLAVVSESGTPGVADPGGTLVSAALDEGLPVRAVPGPSALAAALSVCGFPANRVVFEGFLPVKGGKRRRAIEALAEEKRTIVLYEGPHRVAKTLRELADALGDRRVTIAREITKKFEEIRRATLAEAAQRYEKEKPRGEFTLVIEPAGR
jgi:16S rRNA (cytidine1402-2'-O)-methyltransferase